VRTVAEVSNYVYSISKEGLWMNLYGSNTLNTKLADGTPVQLAQETDYPWDGRIKLKFNNDPGKSFAVFLRIPGWSKGATVNINGKPHKASIKSGEYLQLSGTWKKDDVIELLLPMPAVLMESNPLVEETRNQAAVKRGPVVYCVESADLSKNNKVFDIALSSKASFKPVVTKVAGNNIVMLEGKVQLIQNGNWDKQLYKEVSPTVPTEITVRLVPYFAWGNRGHGEMAVWLRRK
jgi:DUF1680 family protein